MVVILLTPRQTQIAVLVAQGYEYKEIAALLTPRCSYRTVEAHVAKIADKIPNDGRPPLRRVMLWMLAEQETDRAARGAA
jgi:DNA-binding NarL/FixJ family response regulator